MSGTTTAGVSGAIGAALVAILATLFPAYDNNFWGAIVIVAFSLPAFGVAALRYFLRLRTIANETDEVASAHAAAIGESIKAAAIAARRQDEANKETR